MRKKINQYFVTMAEISHKVGVAKEAGDKVVKHDLTSLYDEMVTTDDCSTRAAQKKHERLVDKFDKVVEGVVHDLRELGFEVSEDDCELTIKLKE